MFSMIPKDRSITTLRMIFRWILTILAGETIPSNGRTRIDRNNGQGANYFGDLLQDLGGVFANSSFLNIPGFDFDNPLNVLSLTSPSGNVLEELLKFQRSYAMDVQCLKHMQIFVQALSNRDEWALKMIDAIGKPPSGLLNFNLNWPGEWKECIDVQAVAYTNYTIKSNPTYPFKGQYCSVTYNLPTKQYVGLEVPLTVGVCFPSSCSGSDAKFIMGILAEMLPVNTSSWPEPSVLCHKSSYQLDKTAIAVICVCAVFAGMITLATFYDVVYINWIVKKKKPKQIYKHEGGLAQTGTSEQSISVIEVKSTEDLINTPPEDSQQANIEPSSTIEPARAEKKSPDLLEKIILSFSVFTNGTKILSTDQPKGSLTAVNGIRFISMTWVIVAHSMAWYLETPGVAENYLQYAADLYTRFEFQPIMNGTFSVDTFFVLSGLLVSYLSLKAIKKVNGPLRFNWLMFYFHRFWRLTPPYMLLLMLNATLLPYFAKGPFWNFDLFYNNVCKKNWWRNILYINNFDDIAESCMGWTWYLANDMQFYVLSPLMLVPLSIHPILGGFSCLAFLLVSMVSSGLISQHYDLPATMFSGNADYQVVYYIKPWCRIGSYAIGFFTGYLLYRTKLKCKIPAFANMVGWLVAASLASLVVYGMYTPTVPKTLTPGVAYLYNATSRNVWAACVCWVIFACATGNGGPVNHILSWPGFVPLGRLTYFAYLVHPIIMYIYTASHLKTLYLYDMVTIYDCLGNLTMAYMAAFVLSLTFEAPMLGLEKALWRK